MNPKTKICLGIPSDAGPKSQSPDNECLFLKTRWYTQSIFLYQKNRCLKIFTGKQQIWPSKRCFCVRQAKCGLIIRHLIRQKCLHPKFRYLQSTTKALPRWMVVIGECRCRRCFRSSRRLGDSWRPRCSHRCYYWSGYGRGSLGPLLAQRPTVLTWYDELGPLRRHLQVKFRCLDCLIKCKRLSLPCKLSCTSLIASLSVFHQVSFLNVLRFLRRTASDALG